MHANLPTPSFADAFEVCVLRFALMPTFTRRLLTNSTHKRNMLFTFRWNVRNFSLLFSMFSSFCYNCFVLRVFYFLLFCCSCLSLAVTHFTLNANVYHWIRWTELTLMLSNLRFYWNWLCDGVKLCQTNIKLSSPLTDSWLLIRHVTHHQRPVRTTTFDQWNTNEFIIWARKLGKLCISLRIRYQRRNSR